MIDLVQEILGWVFILAGSAVVLIGGFGTWRLPDFWARLHGASITDSAGVILLITGMCFKAGLTLITVKLIIIGIFLFITGPTAGHAIANAAWVTGLRPTEGDGLQSDAADTPGGSDD